MKSVTPASVFAFRDAHSDEIGYQTVSKPTEDIVKETGNIVTTLVPEQYKPTAVEAKTHSILGRPPNITRNTNGLVGICYNVHVVPFSFNWLRVTNLKFLKKKNQF